MGKTAQLHGFTDVAQIKCTHFTEEKRIVGKEHLVVGTPGLVVELVETVGEMVEKQVRIAPVSTHDKGPDFLHEEGGQEQHKVDEIPVDGVVRQSLVELDLTRGHKGTISGS